MKILLFLAKGFEMIETSAFIDVFGWNRHFNNVKTEIVTCGFNKEVVGTFNIPIRVDLLFNEINIDEYDALAIPGGFGDFGFYEEVYDEQFLNLIRNFNENDKYIASVCVAALPVAKSGVLQGRKGTTYHLMERRRQKQLEAFGVEVVNEPVVVDRNIITSWCPATAPEVALTLLELLTSKAEANFTREIMGYTQTNQSN